MKRNLVMLFMSGLIATSAFAANTEGKKVNPLEMTFEQKKDLIIKDVNIKQVQMNEAFRKFKKCVKDSKSEQEIAVCAYDMKEAAKKKVK